MGLDLLQEYAIPYLHPLAVHFPLVLLLLAAAAAAVYLGTGRALARQAVLALVLVGTATAWWAVQTGEALAEAVEGEPMADVILGTHEAMAEWAVRLGLVASVAAAGVTLALRRRAPAPPGGMRAARAVEPWWARLAVALPTAAAAALVAWTAHLGALMVWGVPA